MISLRVRSAAAIGAVALFFTACSDGSTDPSAARLQPGTASYHNGTNGSSAKSGTLDARVLMDKSGNAFLEVRTGMFVDETNIGVANGWFQTLQYKISNASGKLQQTKNVTFKKSGDSKFVTFIDLCSSKYDDDDDDDHHGSSCSQKIGSNWTVSVQANVKGVGGDGGKTDVVTGTATMLYLPDVDLTNQGLSIVGAGGVLTPATSVNPSTPTTFSVTFPNNKAINGIPNTLGVQTACIVTVDGRPQLPLPNGQYNAMLNPNAFGYVGVNSAAPAIAAGASAPCQFTLSLPAGPHKIVVTAAVAYPGDYDFSNNSTAAFTMNAESANIPVDLVAKPVERVGNGVNGSVIVTPDTVKTGTTITVRSVIQNPTAKASAVNCSISADPLLAATAVGATSNVAVPANGTAACQYTVSASALGTFPITITAMPATGSPVDPSAANNSSTATLRVVASGKFNVTTAANTDLQQQWFNMVGAPALPVDSLTLQNVRTGGLGLLVVSSQSVLGTFTLKGTVISNGVAFPTGTVSGALNKSVAGVVCGLTAGPNAGFTNLPAGFPPQLGYFAEVCAEPATLNGVSGLQQISVSYVQSLTGSIMRPAQYLLTGNVQMKLELSFTLAGSTFADKATATITIPVPTPQLRGVKNLDETKVLWTQQNPAPPVITSP
jgi:hypothetical protein